MQANYDTVWNMMTSIVYPVILAGGSGTRLWPLSRKNFPKQFLKLNGDLSLIQQTMNRVNQLPNEQVVIVSNEDHYFLCQEQLQEFKAPCTYLLEPCAKNTAPAIASAAHYLSQQAGEDAVMLVLPSDHWISNDNAWREAMLTGVQFATEYDAIVTFGIQPNSPQTGYGYIEAGQELSSCAYQVARFREKPDQKSAEEYVKQGNYFWNSGMFVCKAGVYLEELKRFERDIYDHSRQATNNAQRHHDFLRLEEDSFSKCREESIDYAIMEKTSKAVVIPLSMQWSDLGCWNAVADANSQDEHGNTLIGNAIAQDSENCLINSEHLLVTTVGIKDQIIIATNDAVLVANKRYSQQVKELVAALRENHPHLTRDHSRVPRPWGYYEILAEGASFKVKRLMLKPGAKISLQKHQHRAEHWVVVEGEAEVINARDTIYLSINQSTYIPPNTLHRLSNPGDEPLFVIEVQSGHYLGEDDIQRFDDVYLRKTGSIVEV